jgi:hypothetical protein
MTRYPALHSTLPLRPFIAITCYCSKPNFTTSFWYFLFLLFFLGPATCLHCYKNNTQPQYIQPPENSEITRSVLRWLPWKFRAVRLRPLSSFNCKHLRCHNFKISELMQIWRRVQCDRSRVTTVACASLYDLPVFLYDAAFLYNVWPGIVLPVPPTPALLIWRSS